MFAMCYDICSFCQVCLQIAQSIFIGFLLFLLLITGIGILSGYILAPLENFGPATAGGQNLVLLLMTVICMIPLVIDVVRLVKLMKQPATDEN